MCKFTTIRVRRIEAAIIEDLKTVANNLDTLIRFVECDAIPCKTAYRKAGNFSKRFDILLKRLQNALIAADNFERNNNSTDTETYFITNKEYAPTYRAIIDKLEYFGL